MKDLENQGMPKQEQTTDNSNIEKYSDPDQLMDTITQVEDKVENGAKDAVGKTKQVINAPERMEKKFTQKAEKWEKRADNLEETADIVSDLVDNPEARKQAKEDLKSKGREKIEKGKETVQKVKEKTKEAIKDPKKTIKNVKDIGKKKFTSAKGAVKDKVNQARSSFKEGVDSAKKRYKAIKENPAEAAKRVKKLAKNKGKDVLKNINPVTKVKNKVDSIKRTAKLIKRMVKAARRSVKSLAKIAKKTGKVIAQAGKAIIEFLVSNPLGWAIDVILVIILICLLVYFIMVQGMQARAAGSSMFASEDDLIVNTDYMPEIVISNRSKLEEAIKTTYSGKTQENYLSVIDELLTIQNTYNVNAAFALAVFQIESTGGTNWGYISPETYNWQSVHNWSGSTRSKGGTLTKQVGGTVMWATFISFNEATLDFGEYISTHSAYFQSGNYTIKSISTSYCNETWAINVNNEMKKILQNAGIDVEKAIEEHNKNASVGENTGEITGVGHLTGKKGEGYWNSYQRGTRTFKLYYQNYLKSSTGKDWGVTTGLCYCTSHAISESGLGGTQTPKDLYNKYGWYFRSRLDYTIDSGTAYSNWDQVVKNLNHNVPTIFYGYMPKYYYASGNHAVIALDMKDDRILIVNTYYSAGCASNDFKNLSVSQSNNANAGWYLISEFKEFLKNHPDVDITYKYVPASIPSEKDTNNGTTAAEGSITEGNGTLIGYKINNSDYYMVTNAEETKNYVKKSGYYQEYASRYGDYCLGFAMVYAETMNTEDFSLVDRNKEEGNEPKLNNGFSKYLYDSEHQYVSEIIEQLKKNKAQVIQVNGNTEGTSRHYVTAIGYKKNANINNLSQKDLLILDVWDDQIEQMNGKGSGTRFLTTHHEVRPRESGGYVLYKTN